MKYEVEVKNLPGSEVEIVGEISVEEFEKERAGAIAKINSEIKMDGFRQGHVPENILIQKIGEQAILEEMAEMALRKAYPAILDEHKIKAIGYPKISLTKIAKGNPLGFKAQTAVAPEVVLSEYKDAVKKINDKNKKEEEKISVEEKEIEETIDRLRKMRAKQEKIVGEDGKETEKEILPELNDDFAKQIGKFTNLEELKKSIRENMLEEKKMKLRDKGRVEAVEAIMETAKMEVPAILAEEETNRMVEEMKNNIIHAGMKWEDYIAHLKKTEEDIRKDFGVDALKRVKFGLTLDAVAEKEKVEIPEEELKTESEKLANYYKNFGQDIPMERIRAYMYRTLRNEKVFKLLESF